MSAPTRRPEPEGRRAAPERILDAAAARIVAVGAANLSLQDVADAADVSKGLIHYHFKEKETLLAILAQWIGRETVRREAEALVSSTPSTAVDDLWAWLSAELQRGHLRALQDLACEPAPKVREAVILTAAARREAAADTITRLFDLLGLRLRLPVPAVADVIVAFVDGLSVYAMLQPDTNHRVTFDVFWLSLLSLAE